MATTILLEEQIEIPANLDSLAAFRAWATSDDFPERGRIDFLGGRIEVDMSPEDLYCHGTLKVELVGAFRGRVKADSLGSLFTDSTRVSCPAAGVSAEPDLVFVSEESLDAGRVRPIAKSTGEPDRYVELEGPPDLIVEIVSDASVRKDTERLPLAYYAAGVSEYWLVDARGKDLIFLIHRRGPAAYEPVEADADGYQHSAVFERRYRLDRGRNARGRVEFDLKEKKGV